MLKVRLRLNIKTFCPTGPGGGVDPSCGGTGGKKPSVPNPSGTDTFEQHQSPGGGWSKERQALHKEIIDSHFEGKSPVKEPIGYVMGGGPASGKSSIIKGGHVKVEENTVHIDSDMIKAKLPEYSSMIKAGASNAASFVHEESSYLANEIQKRASSGSYNSLLDGTGDSSLEKLSGKIKGMKANGQKVVAHYVTVPTEVAVQRNIERAKETGRLPPETMLRATHASVSRVVPSAVKSNLYDEFTLWDTSAGVRKVASKSGSSELKIHNDQLWNSFVAKGNE